MISEKLIDRFRVDQLEVQIYTNRQALGVAAARDTALKMKELMLPHENLRMVFAAAPSQNEFLLNLTARSGLNWNKVEGFHMDEYLRLKNDAIEQSFGMFLKKRLFEKVRFHSVHYLPFQTDDPETACIKYSGLLQEAPIDIIAMGIGENGHIAFNDPSAADLNDPKVVKVVQLEDECRQQQVNDGCFNRLIDVPEWALTMTIPALLSGKHIFCIVPGTTKAEAVYRALNGPIDASCPATVLRNHPNAVLYLDPESANKL